MAWFHWGRAGVHADFVLPSNREYHLRVRFAGQTTVRLLDELALSTEDDGLNEGLVPEHFAYEVSGAEFCRMQSWEWKSSVGGVRHFRFVTGWTCVDVLSPGPPEFHLVSAESPLT